MNSNKHTHSLSLSLSLSLSVCVCHTHSGAHQAAGACGGHAGPDALAGPNRERAPPRSGRDPAQRPRGRCTAPAGSARVAARSIGVGYLGCLAGRIAAIRAP
jgi:hypothetical protein